MYLYPTYSRTRRYRDRQIKSVPTRLHKDQVPTDIMGVCLRMFQVLHNPDTERGLKAKEADAAGHADMKRK